MKRLPVNIDEIAMAMENAGWDYEYYLDCQTGDVIMVDPELTGLDDLDEDELEAFTQKLPEWQREHVPEVLSIYGSEEGRYRSVPSMGSGEPYRDMVEFAGTVEDDNLRELLFVALDGRGAFGRFKRVLGGHPRERERWFEFRDERMYSRVLDWLCDLGIEPVDGPPADR